MKKAEFPELIGPRPVYPEVDGLCGIYGGYA